jgi:regulator of replication initiation timing
MDATDIDRVWEFFRNEQKINKNLREHIRGLQKSMGDKMEALASAERIARDLATENARLRAENAKLKVELESKGQQR